MDTSSRYKLLAAGCGVVIIVLIALGFFFWKSLDVQGSPLGVVAGESTSSAPVVVPIAVSTSTDVVVPQFQYIEVTDSCGPYLDGGPCVNMRSGPGLNYPSVLQLRNGIVLKVVSTTVADGHTWYQIGFDGVVRYPERVTSAWYVSGDYVTLFSDPGPSATNKINASSTKRIIVDLTNETLYAYDGDTLFMQQAISTGLELTPTAVGKFWVMRKTPDSYMQGPIPGLSDQVYDLPGVPWDLYFTNDGAAIHGAYWHNHFGEPWSHGCVNLPPDQAKILYAWADLGTPVTVQDFH